MNGTILALALVASALAQEPGGAEKQDSYLSSVKDHTKKEGVFRVWRNKESLLYEIPTDMIGRDFLWITEIKQTPLGGYNGTAVLDRLVRWEQLDDKVLLRTVNYRVRATDGGAIKLAIRQSNVRPIVQAFDVKGKGPQGGLLIDVGRFYKSDIPEFSVRSALGAQSIDALRTFLEGAAVFPNNINVTVLMTFQAGQQQRAGFFSGAGDGGPTKTALVSHSMTLLPEKPMEPRLWDSRVGYFTVDVQDFADRFQGVEEYKFITRHRLEKKDPSAAVSEPVAPIVFYLAPEVPEKWRSYMKKGVEDWQPAFEQAGFKNAIVCRDAPSSGEDPDWSPEDARYNVIRWAPLPIANAMGPSVADPRSGEIISAHIIMWHDVLKLCVDWYFAQASPNDPRARRSEFPEDLLGELLRFIVAHEVGHTLGLQHNGKSSGTVPIRLLRDPKWTRENGTATSIMDYARFNYVAQPGDGASLMPIVGKYDKFAIEWGYKPILSADSPEAERRTLDEWAAKQVTDPQLRFGSFSGSDPTAQSEALGDNAVEASSLGVANLKRLMGFLKPAATKMGEDYTDLSRFHANVIEQFSMYVMHVAAVIGGVEQIDWHAGRGGTTYTPVPADYQRSAVKWMIENVFTPPRYLFPPDVAYNLGLDGGVNGIQGLQQLAVNLLLSDTRLNRMIANEAVDGSKAFRASEFLGTVRTAVWRELSMPSPTIDVLRRNLQRVFVNALGRKLGAASSEVKALATAELEAQSSAIGYALPKVKDAVTLAHLREIRRHIQFALANPDKLSIGAPAAPFSPFAEADGCPLCVSEAASRLRRCDVLGLWGHAWRHALP